ncbi:TetR/AcrR family transcriptional regulator [Streptomyces sp. NPDC050560]|uniref:TetR/AcrR family transcriptional regulator n=1 Tax=Streptomyces sp. NPDC050560 TaxID=3365630 RepID=UPI0037B48974
MAGAADRTRAAGPGGRPQRTSVWLDGTARRGRSARRAEQPSGLGRDRITEVSVRLLDAEGLARFSMRRLATELNVTAMSLYWYVDTKDDLLELALDAAFGEIALPAAGAARDWRAELRALAGEYRALLVRHPWVSSLVGMFLNIGPHFSDFSRTVRRVIGGTGLSAGRQRGAIAAVFQFVYGFGTMESLFLVRCAAAGMTEDAYYGEAVARAPQGLWRMADGGGESAASVRQMREKDFGVALELLVSGIEALRR